MRKSIPALGGLLALAVLTGASQAPAQSEAIRQVREYRTEHEREILAELEAFLALPNVADDVEDMRRNAGALVAMMEERGIETRILETGAVPHIFGELKVPGATRTVLFYCHYDGQPVDPSRWVGHRPFDPVYRDGSLDEGAEIVELPASGPIDPDWRLYGRSASDDKSPIVALLTALDALDATGIQPTVNLKFLFEGDEEAGSPTLGEIVRDQGELLAADLLVAADGPSDPSGRPTAYFGARGITTLEITVYGPLRPLHSGHYGNWAPNPAMRMAQLLASMKDPDSGRVLVDGFYDDVVPLSDFERRALEQAPNDDAAQMQAFAIAATEMEGRRYELLNLPSLNVRGLRSGWVGDEARTIVPDVAIASIDLRLVKDIQPAEQSARVVRHMESRGYHVVEEEPDAELRREHERLARVVVRAGYPAFRTSMDLPVSRALIGAIEGHTGRDPVLYPTTGGSVPLYLFTDVLEVPTVIVPIVNHDNNQHSPNENVRLGHLWAGIETLAAAMLMR